MERTSDSQYRFGTSRICYTSGASRSAMNQCGSGGAGLDRGSSRRPIIVDLGPVTGLRLGKSTCRMLRPTATDATNCGQCVAKSKVTKSGLLNLSRVCPRWDFKTQLVAIKSTTYAPETVRRQSRFLRQQPSSLVLSSGLARISPVFPRVSEPARQQRRLFPSMPMPFS